MPPLEFRERAALLREWQRRFVGEARTVATERKIWVRGMVIALGAAVALTILAPLGSDAIALPPRFAYWFVQLIGGSVIGIVVTSQFARNPWWDDRPLRLGLAVAVAITLPISLFAWLVTAVSFGGVPLTVEGLWRVVLPCFTVSWCMCTINALAGRQPAETHDHGKASPSLRFVDRLPPKLRGAEIWAVEAEDHYLRVHTSQGRDMLLMRLSDAIVELDGIEGSQTHRSWWIARAAVTGAVTANGRASLTLKDGTTVPVSRSFARILRSGGWFD